MHNSGASAPRHRGAASRADYKMDMNPRAIPAFADAWERVYRDVQTRDRVASQSPKEIAKEQPGNNDVRDLAVFAAADQGCHASQPHRGSADASIFGGEGLSDR